MTEQNTEARCRCGAVVELHQDGWKLVVFCPVCGRKFAMLKEAVTPDFLKKNNGDPFALLKIAIRRSNGLKHNAT